MFGSLIFGTLSIDEPFLIREFCKEKSNQIVSKSTEKYLVFENTSGQGKYSMNDLQNLKSENRKVKFIRHYYR